MSTTGRETGRSLSFLDLLTVYKCICGGATAQASPLLLRRPRGAKLPQPTGPLPRVRGEFAWYSQQPPLVLIRVAINEGSPQARRSVREGFSGRRRPCDRGCGGEDRVVPLLHVRAGRRDQHQQQPQEQRPHREPVGPEAGPLVHPARGAPARGVRRPGEVSLGTAAGDRDGAARGRIRRRGRERCGFEIRSLPWPGERHLARVECPRRDGASGPRCDVTRRPRRGAATDAAGRRPGAGRAHSLGRASAIHRESVIQRTSVIHRESVIQRTSVIKCTSAIQRSQTRPTPRSLAKRLLPNLVLDPDRLRGDQRACAGHITVLFRMLTGLADGLASKE